MKSYLVTVIIITTTTNTLIYTEHWCLSFLNGNDKYANV